MSLYIEEECEVDFAFDYRALAKRVTQYCLRDAIFPFEAQLSLTLTDDSGIRELNREYRGIDAATDVLSFPMLDYEQPENFRFLIDGPDPEDNFDPDTGEAVLGDIVISVEHVHAQAAEYGHSEEREFAFLIVHSMLHLFGHDHMTDDEREVMESRQRELMTGLGIPRESVRVISGDDVV